MLCGHRVLKIDKKPENVRTRDKSSLCISIHCVFKKDTVISKDEARQCAIRARKAARVKSGNGCGLEGLGVTGHAGETGLNTEMKQGLSWGIFLNGYPGTNLTSAYTLGR